MSGGRSATLRFVEKGALCSGCGLCAAVAEPGAVEMRLQADGYLRPQVLRDLSPQEDALVASTCPGLRLRQENTEGEDHAIWGPVLKTRIGHATDPALRFHASSGGVLSATLIYLLESNAVDYVVQTAESPESPVHNAIAESFERSSVYHAAGSRYGPSAPLSDVRRQLQQPGRFAFVGKPCDVAALRALGRHDPRVAAKIPFIVSFFCAGVPSLKGTKEILAKLGVSDDEVAGFRYRGDGWPGATSVKTRDGRTLQMSYAEAWGGILSRHLQFRCKICPDGSGGFADMVCADAWYGDDNGYPAFAESEGRSLVITRTRKGEDLVLQAQNAGYITLSDVDIDEVARMQPFQARRKMLIVSRLAALALLARPRPRYEGLRLMRAARMAGLRDTATSFLGMLKRLLMPMSEKPPVRRRRPRHADLS
jgi:coenzyme F420 hydrogenase subunit beta